MKNNNEQVLINNGVSYKDRIMVALVAILGILFCEFSFDGLGISVPAFLIIFYAVVLWYFKQKGERLSKQGKLLFIPISLLALCFLIFSNPLLKFFNVLLLFFLIIIQLGVLNNVLKNRLFSFGTLADFFTLSVALPILNFTKIFKVISNEDTNKSLISKTVFNIVIGVIISIPALLIVIALLMSADAVFNKVVMDILNFIAINIGEYIFKVVFGLFLAIPLFGLLYSLKNKQNKGLVFIDTSKINNAQKVNNTIINTALILLCIIYILFIGLQFSYLFNGFIGKLPKNFIVSEYARRGFFEMEVIAIINYLILLVSYIIAKRKNSKIIKVTKTLFSAITVLTVLLITTALSKMFLYVDIFGLTPLRIYTLWFMLLTIIFFIILILKIFIKNISFFRSSMLSFIVLFIILNFSCIDFIIPKYNIDRYINDNSKKVDVLMFRDLSYEMMPQLARLLDVQDENIKKDAQNVFYIKAQKIYKQKHWQEFNISSYFARKIADKKITSNFN